MTARSGQIVGFYGTMGSGIATLAIAIEPQGYVAHVPCENAPTVRALRDAFGNDVIGQEIEFVIDDRGLLSTFTPQEV
jgi:hypothetical protein